MDKENQGILPYCLFSAVPGPILQVDSSVLNMRSPAAFVEIYEIIFLKSRSEAIQRIRANLNVHVRSSTMSYNRIAVTYSIVTHIYVIFLDRNIPVIPLF